MSTSPDTSPTQRLPTTPREVELLVLGGGVAGLAVARAFGEGALVVDAALDAYKIGESVIPEQFHDPRMAACIEAVRALPSWSPKAGTLFCDGDERAFFPLAQHADRSMHVFRQELEPTLRRLLGVEVEQARVTAIDLPRRTVETTAGAFRSRLPIVDCSGPAMLVAAHAGLIADLWPVWATWGYCDAEADDDAFWRSADAAAWRMTALDVPSGDLLPLARDACHPSELTTLTRVRDGVWSWQIPLWRRRILSVGLVSRLGPVDDDALRAAVASTLQPCWRATLREAPGGRADAKAMADDDAIARGDIARFGAPLPPSTRRIHRRAGFARHARRAAGADFVLVGDAYAFADPVYSVGTGLAVTAGLQLGDHLRGHGWRPADADAWHAKSEAVLLRALDAFRFWYDGSVLRDRDEAVGVQEDFLVGLGFRGDAFTAYSSVVAAAQRGAEARVAALVRAGLPAGFAVAAVRAAPETRAVLVDVRLDPYGDGNGDGDGDIVTLEVARDAGAPAWWRGAGLRLSYRLHDNAAAYGPALQAALGTVRDAVNADAARWIHALTLVDAMREAPSP